MAKDKLAGRHAALRTYEKAHVRSLTLDVLGHEAEAAAYRAQAEAERVHLKYERAVAAENAAWNAYDALSGNEAHPRPTTARTGHHESMLTHAEAEVARREAWAKERRAHLAEVKRQIADDEAFYRGLARHLGRAS